MAEKQVILPVPGLGVLMLDREVFDAALAARRSLVAAGVAASPRER